MTRRFSRKHFLAAAAGFMWLPQQATAAQGQRAPRSSRSTMLVVGPSAKCVTAD
jgi:hypothetical protein